MTISGRWLSGVALVRVGVKMEAEIAARRNALRAEVEPSIRADPVESSGGFQPPKSELAAGSRRYGGF
jgi:hypothetical protein